MQRYCIRRTLAYPVKYHTEIARTSRPEMYARLMTAALLACIVAMPALASPFTGTNCLLAAPPVTAGDDIIFGMVAKIYPRVKFFPSGYTGCQIVWVEENRNWRVLNVTYFEDGDAVSFWKVPPDELLCKYHSGRVVDPADERCPPYKSLGTKSTNPGCVNRVLDRGNTQGCEYE